MHPSHPPGHLVSAFVKQNLPVLLANRLASGAPPPRALAEGFLEVDARLGASRVDVEFSGSTCVVAHVRVRAEAGRVGGHFSEGGPGGPAARRGHGCKAPAILWGCGAACARSGGGESPHRPSHEAPAPETTPLGAPSSRRRHPPSLCAAAAPAGLPADHGLGGRLALRAGPRGAVWRAPGGGGADRGPQAHQPAGEGAHPAQPGARGEVRPQTPRPRAGPRAPDAACNRATAGSSAALLLAAALRGACGNPCAKPDSSLTTRPPPPHPIKAGGRGGRASGPLPRVAAVRLGARPGHEPRAGGPAGAPGVLPPTLLPAPHSRVARSWMLGPERAAAASLLGASRFTLHNLSWGRSRSASGSPRVGCSPATWPASLRATPSRAALHSATPGGGVV
jgi:hypothetical protein